MSFNTAPTTNAATKEFDLLAGQTVTLTLYQTSGAGLPVGAVVKIQKETSAGSGVFTTVGALTTTNPCQVLEAAGGWKLDKAASDDAYGFSGEGDPT